MNKHKAYSTYAIKKKMKKYRLTLVLKVDSEMGVYRIRMMEMYIKKKLKK